MALARAWQQRLAVPLAWWQKRWVTATARRCQRAAKVQCMDGDLDLATPASGIRGTMLCQGEAPNRKTLRIKARLLKAEAFPTTLKQSTLWRRTRWLTLRRQIRQRPVFSHRKRPHGDK